MSAPSIHDVAAQVAPILAVGLARARGQEHPTPQSPPAAELARTGGQRVPA